MLGLYDRSILKLTFPLIQWAKDNDTFNLLAIWLMLKREYRSGHIHNFNKQRLASRNTIGSWVSKLIEVGLIIRTESGYQCLSLKEATRKIAGYKKAIHILIIDNSTKSNVVLQLRAIAIKDNLRKQRYMIFKRTGLQPSMSNKRIQRIKNNAGRQTNHQLILTDKLSGKLINRSDSTGRNLKRRIAANQIFNIKPSELILVKQNVSYELFRQLCRWNGEATNKYRLIYRSNNIYRKTTSTAVDNELLRTGRTRLCLTFKLS